VWILLLFVLVSMALAAMRSMGRVHDADPWARAARRLRPVLSDIEAELRRAGRPEDADRIAACARTLRGWEAPR
jgi:hypothetical protein